MLEPTSSRGDASALGRHWPGSGELLAVWAPLANISQPPSLQVLLSQDQGPSLAPNSCDLLIESSKCSLVLANPGHTGEPHLGVPSTLIHLFFLFLQEPSNSGGFRGFYIASSSHNNEPCTEHQHRGPALITHLSPSGPV